MAGNAASLVELLGILVFVMVAANGSIGLKLKVSNVYSTHSPFNLTSECRGDAACVWELHRRRLLASHMAERSKKRSPTSNTSVSSNVNNHRELVAARSPVEPGSKGSEYYVSLWAGKNNTQQVYVLLDSGSELLWISCNPYDPNFPPEWSTFDPKMAGCVNLTMYDLYCQMVQNDEDMGIGADEKHCNFAIAYRDGSGTSGLIVKSTFIFQDDDDPNSGMMFDINFGCGMQAQSMLALEGSGFLGVARGFGLSLPEQLGASSLGVDYSYCLPSVEGTGYLLLGRDSFPPPGNYSITSFVDVPPRPGFTIRFWYINVVGMEVNGGLVMDIPGDAFQINIDGSGGTRIDSGEELGLLSKDIYFPLRTAWRQAMADTFGLQKSTRYPPFDTCYLIYTWQLASLPFVSVIVDNNKKITSNNVIDFPINDRTTYVCWPFILGTNPKDPAVIISGKFQESLQMIFDTTKFQLGWREKQC